MNTEIRDMPRAKGFILYILENIIPWRLGAFIGICLLFGGTSQYISNLKIIVYLMSLALIGLVLCEKNRKPLKMLLRPPVLLGALFVLVFALYLVPLPPSIWTSLPGREVVVEGFNLVERPLPWMSLSLAPEVTLFSLMDFIPVLAICLIVMLSAKRKELHNSYFVIVGLAVASVFLSVFQVLLGVQSFYFYTITNEGFAVGFFSNANHNATFLAMALPLAIYLGFYTPGGRKLKSEKRPAGCIAALLIAIGILMTGSTAGYLILILVLFLLAYTLLRKTVWRPRILVGFCIVSSLMALDFFLFGGQVQEFVSKFTAESNTSRSVVFNTTWDASRDFGFFGSGPGSFEGVYKLYEDREAITRLYLPHAHNDYLQIWLEMGVLGSLIVATGFIWFVITAGDNLRRLNRTNVVNIIIVIALCVPILHSFVDYPLRNISLSVLFFYFLLLLDRFNAEH